jgi:Rrf2 family transcriptional regulator, nitric oxide-sensitive transcriptional repressor
MKLNLFVDLGLRTLVRLATKPDETVTTVKIAEEFDISRHHLLKVVRVLSQGGVITNTRGVGGGIRLALPAEKIHLGHVVRLLNRDQEVVTCIAERGACAVLARCKLKPHLNDALEAFYHSLDSVLLSECIF